MQNRSMFPYRRHGPKKRTKGGGPMRKARGPQKGLPNSARDLLPLLQPATKALAQMLAGRTQISGQLEQARAMLSQAERLIADRVHNRLNPGRTRGVLRAACPAAADLGGCLRRGRGQGGGGAGPAAAAAAAGRPGAAQGNGAGAGEPRGRPAPCRRGFGASSEASSASPEPELRAQRPKTRGRRRPLGAMSRAAPARPRPPTMPSRRRRRNPSPRPMHPPGRAGSSRSISRAV